MVVSLMFMPTTSGERVRKMPGLTLTATAPPRKLADIDPDDYRQERNERKRATRNAGQNLRAAEHAVNFIAVDGEGVGKGKDHKYVLLACGQEQIENHEGISWWEAFSFLYSQYREDAAFVGFFLGYDFTQILKTLPYDRAKILLDKAELKKRERKASGGNHTPFPVVIDVPTQFARGCDHAKDEIPPSDHIHVAGRRWQFDLLPPSRRLRLRPKYCQCISSDCPHQMGCQHKTKEQIPADHYHWSSVDWMYVNDCGTFFQTSFMSAIDPRKWSRPVVTPEEYAILQSGKANRDNAALDDDMKRYNLLENEILTRLMSRLNSGLVNAGIRLSRDQWFGPGQAAQAWMIQQHELTRRDKTLVPAWVREIGQATYYGGWFEIMAHGHVPGSSWEYDINSAYPYIIANLPCLEHGEWTRGEGYPSKLAKGHLRMVNVTVHGTDPYMGPLMYRSDKGNISRPYSTKGWYWDHELRASINAGLINDITYHEWAEYAPCDCLPPLRALASLYEERLTAGKKTPYGIALKLIYNSVYGKMAQSVGHPRYGNAIYASLITAGCRTMILSAIATHPEKSKAVLMVATDGVYFTSPHPKLRTSEKLGQWGAEEKHNLTLFKPGVYWDDKARQAIAQGEDPEFKSRGVSAKALARVIGKADEQFSTWSDAPGGFPVVKFKTAFSMVTMLQALQGKYGRTWSKAGYVSSGKEVIQDSNPEQKRFPILEYDEEYGIYRSFPHDRGGKLETTPYDKAFGWNDESEEEYGITDDGPVLMGFRKAVGVG